MLLFENYSPDELPLPETSVVGEDFDSILEKGVVYCVRVALFEVIFKLLYSLLKVFGGIELKVELPSHPDFIELLVVLRMGSGKIVEVNTVLLNEAGVDST